MVAPQDAKRVVMNAPGSAGRMLKRRRVLENMAQELIPETNWENNISSEKYTLRKPYAMDGNVLIFSASHKLRKVLGGYLYAVLPSCSLVMVKGFEILFGLSNMHDAKKSLAEIDDVILPERQALAYVLIKQSLHTLDIALNSLKNSRHQGDSRHRVCLLPALPPKESEVFRDYPQFSDMQGQLDELKQKARGQGITICYRASAISQGVSVQDVPAFRKWAPVIDPFGVERFIDSCLQQYSAYKIDNAVDLTVGESYLVKLERDCYRIDFSSPEKATQIRVMALLSHVLAPYFATQQKNLLLCAEELVELFHYQVTMEMTTVEGQWLDDLDKLELITQKRNGVLTNHFVVN